MNNIHHSIERSASIEYPRHFVELNKQHPKDNSKISPILSLYLTAPLSDNSNDKITLCWENKESFQSVKKKAESFLNDNFNEWIDEFGDYHFKLSHSRIYGYLYEYMIKDNPDLTLTLNNIKSFLKGERKLKSLYLLSDDWYIPELEDFGKPYLSIYRTATKPECGTIQFSYGIDDLTYYNPMRSMERNQFLENELTQEMVEYLLGEAHVVSKNVSARKYPIKYVSKDIYQEGFEKTFTFNFQIGE